MYSSVTSLYCITRSGTWLSNVYSYSKPRECHALSIQYAWEKWEMHTKLKSINLNLNGRDLCMAGSKIFNSILRKEDRKMLTQFIWGLLVGCEHSDDGLCSDQSTHSLKWSLSLKCLNIFICYETFSSQLNDWAHCCLQHEPLNKTRIWLRWLSQALTGS